MYTSTTRALVADIKQLMSSCYLQCLAVGATPDVSVGGCRLLPIVYEGPTKEEFGSQDGNNEKFS